MLNHTEIHPQDERANKETHNVLLLELMPSIPEKNSVGKKIISYIFQKLEGFLESFKIFFLAYILYTRQ